MLSATLCSDILAIRCIKDHVCIGVGNCLCVYDVKTRKLVGKLAVLQNDNIHSIVEGSKNKLFVYGGKSLGICEFEVTDDGVRLDLHSPVHLFSDWIISVQSSKDDDTRLAILFAHNNLGFYDSVTRLTHFVHCQEKCILYGGSLFFQDNGQTVIFSGTVFQEILIWCVNSNLAYSDDVAVLHRLKGHKGVIFSVVYDPVLRIVSSTSDDRTIRLWSVTNKITENKNAIHWDDAEINLKTTMYGHTARVWRSVIKNNRIISIGEDSLMCMWTIDGQLLNKVEAHHGAEIWSIDINDRHKTIFTGGADGAVNVWPFEFTESLKIESLLENDKCKIPKYAFYMNSGNVCIFIDGGELISHNRTFQTNRTSLNLPRYSNYCIMQISPDKKNVGLGSKDGYIEIYKEFHDGESWKLQKSLEKKIIDSKIFSLHWLSDEIILICGDQGRLKLFNISAETHDNSEPQFVLPASRERWTTAAIIHENLLICGDRAGSIYAFNLHEQTDNKTFTQIFSKIHGRLGVQFLTVSGNKILSAGRDGTVRSYALRNSETGKSLKAQHLKKMPMDWVCRIVKIDADLYVLGFKEVEFMIYSMNLQRLVQRFVCGGGHRSWDCRIADGTMNFAYIKDKRVYELRRSLRNTNLPILDGFHTKHIYCVQPILTSNSCKILVSTGEDSSIRLSCIIDTKLGIERYRLKTLDICDGHISNVKSLAVLNLQDSEKYTKNLVFSGGGRAQLKIWEISVKVEEDNLTSEDVACTELLSYMLRGTDKDRRKTWQNVEPAFFVDPETRFMDISVQAYEQDKRYVVLFVACSDGFLRVFLYDTLSNNLHICNDVNYCNRCILKIHSFSHEVEIILLTMTTDGFVSFWRMNESIEKLVRSVRENEQLQSVTNKAFARMKIHQSGINSFDFRKLDNSHYLLLTGGDDNLISLVLLEISLYDEGFRVNKISEWNSSSIHSAQITGVRFLKNNRMLSTGIDQRIIVYSYFLDDGVLSVSQTEEAMTFVPDVQGAMLLDSLERNEEKLVCVYGKGLEVIILDIK